MHSLWLVLTSGQVQSGTVRLSTPYTPIAPVGPRSTLARVGPEGWDLPATECRVLPRGTRDPALFGSDLGFQIKIVCHVWMPLWGKFTSSNRSVNTDNSVSDGRYSFEHFVWCFVLLFPLGYIRLLIPVAFTHKASKYINYLYTF